ncbi:hypothetical protein JZ751_002046 [Albula glossodonta]|uniref:Uncharacterized protein n=1 Tax=Albula glossodonta TaxID=121402 RepID=A0A8T2PAR2_9TELE|nr:hypothetical protein JZ751_002046 [Albula glossodonta]
MRVQRIGDEVRVKQLGGATASCPFYNPVSPFIVAHPSAALASLCSQKVEWGRRQEGSNTAPAAGTGQQWSCRLEVERLNLLLPPCLCVPVSEEASLEEQVRRIKDIEAIESESFVAQAFKSTRDGKKASETAEMKQEAEPDDHAVEKLEVSLPTVIHYHDTDSLAHPSELSIWKVHGICGVSPTHTGLRRLLMSSVIALCFWSSVSFTTSLLPLLLSPICLSIRLSVQLFMDKEEAEERWLNRLIALRQERLMGSPVP